MKLKHIMPLLQNGEVNIYEIRGYEEETLFKGKAHNMKSKKLLESEIVRVHADMYERGVVFIELKRNRRNDGQQCSFNIKSGRMSHKSKV